MIRFTSTSTTLDHCNSDILAWEAHDEQRRLTVSQALLARTAHKIQRRLPDSLRKR
jgi:hypothetical protein